MSELDNDIDRTKKNLEAAMQAFVTAQYGPDHWLGDYTFSAVVIDMNVGAGPQQTHYLHDGRGPAHSLRGLTVEQEEWLMDLRMEEREDKDAD